MSRIVELKAQNVRRLRAVHIMPDGSLVQITGRNGQGKSSCLDAIAMALAGKRWEGAKPIREGADKGEIVVKLDNGLTIRRLITESGGSLTITDEKGSKLASPQAVLDKMAGSLTFDPLAFSRMDPKQQAETLKKLVGLDFTAIDQERAQIFNRRTEVNRNAKALEVRVNALPFHPKAPKEEVSVAKLADELNAAIRANADCDTRQQSLRAAKQDLASVDAEIEDLTRKLGQLKARRNEWAIEVDKRQAALDGIAKIDTAPLQQQIADADTINRQVRANADRLKLEKELETLALDADALTKDLDSIDADKQSALAAAKFPVPGLSFDETGVLYNGIPFAQASSAEKLRVSVAMGIAMAPEIKIMLVRDGSLLDEDNLAMIARMAEESESQIWIEKVDSTGTVGIVIEDGMSVEPVTA